jgi:hypothetical protein
MSYFSKRALRWAAPVALVGALGLAACGNSDDSDEAIRTNAGPVAQASGLDNHLDIRATELAQQERADRAAAASVGLDNHLDIRAKQLARERAEQQLLDRQAGSNEADAAQRAAEAASVRAAEQAERSAHLEGQANTYSGTNVSSVVEAGNRAAQAAAAESYVEQQQDRAESNSYDGEFLPGSRHVPVR